MPQAKQVQSDIAEAIEEARSLERERGALAKRVADNREYLRLMDRRGKLSDEEGQWLDDFYPLKEKGRGRSKEEIERTRKLREEARKGVDGTDSAQGVEVETE